jgi:hypothetical protein
MTLVAQANQAMMQACDRAEILAAKLQAARARKASPLVLQGLERAYAQYNDKVTRLWDEWNDAMLVERLARI